jgi:hypothetical protein
MDDRIVNINSLFVVAILKGLKFLNLQRLFLSLLQFEDCTFDWLYWPQAKEPYSPDTIEYIKSLNAEEDIKLLKSHGWELPPECARILRISTMLLQKGAEKGLTPFTIGSIMCRETLNKNSAIEQIVQKAEEAALPGTSEAAFLDLVSAIMDNHLEELFT